MVPNAASRILSDLFQLLALLAASLRPHNQMSNIPFYHPPSSIIHQHPHLLFDQHLLPILQVLLLARCCFPFPNLAWTGGHPPPSSPGRPAPQSVASCPGGPSGTWICWILLDENGLCMKKKGKKVFTWKPTDIASGPLSLKFPKFIWTLRKLHSCPTSRPKNKEGTSTHPLHQIRRSFFCKYIPQNPKSN